MSLKLYSPALTRLAGEKTRQTLSNAYAAILPHPFTLGLSYSNGIAIQSLTQRMIKQIYLGFYRAASQ